MAGIAALFIVGIVAAYNYASRTSPADMPATANVPSGHTTGSTAGTPAPTSGSPTRKPATTADTTGAGNAERGAPAQLQTMQ